MTVMMPTLRLHNYPVTANHRGNLLLCMDVPLLLLVMALLSLGWVMVTTASLDYAAHTTGDMFYFCKRHGVYVLLALLTGAVVLNVSFATWRRIDVAFLVLAVLLLLLVLVPGIGRKVNGSQRWLGLGFMTMQVSEIAKWASMVFFAGYLVRRREDMHRSLWGFSKPFLVLAMLAGLLLAEPDFGATVVIGASTLALLFLAGAPLLRFLLLMTVCLVAAGFLAVMESYRMARLLAFINPWEESVMYGSGYQLTQSLIAIGRGEWYGVGLGHSVQKLFYLPEAHTDFVFSIWAEEAGLLGCVLVIALFAALVWRMFVVAGQAAARGEQFGALVATGMALLVAFQAFINMGVTAGLLPTKGLTLPFISYGGSSLIVSVAMAAMVLRLSFENRAGFENRAVGQQSTGVVL